jgi:membrane-bound lytic murein transglycosylase D
MKLKILSPLFFSLCVTLPSGCSTTHKEESTVNGIEPESGSVSEPELEDASQVEQEVESDEIDEFIDKQLQAKSGEIVPEIGSEEDEINQILKSGIPVELNEKVEKWIDYFTNKNPGAFQRFMDRGQPYKKLIAAVLRDRGIPTELYYLAMIESGFVLHAKSPMSAVGFWQFIPATGRRYGLRVDNYVDERRDPRRATVAASMYLSDLNNVFDSWYLALSAYNAGETRIMNAIMRGKSRDFWQLVKNKGLPSETMDYIPKFMAAFIIGTNPEKYGFRRPTAEPWEDLVAVPVPSPVSLNSIAEIINVPVATLQQSNPHLTRGMTPPGSPNYKIWVPTAMRVAIEENQEKLAAARVAIHNRPLVANIGGKGSPRKYHRVSRGENLALIADKYGISVAHIKKINNLRSSNIQAGMKLKIHASTTMPSVEHRLANNAELGKLSRQERKERIKQERLAALKESTEIASNDQDSGTYRVRRGDNLHDIAKRFGMSVVSLKRINKLRDTDLRVGQILRVASNS